MSVWSLAHASPNVGNHVLCLDVDSGKIERLRRGDVPIHEPGLESVVVRNNTAGRLEFTSDYERAAAHGDLFFIAVGTPTDETGSADVRHVENVAQQLGRHIARNAIVVVKSTVPVGTHDRVAREIPAF